MREGFVPFSSPFLPIGFCSHGRWIRGSSVAYPDLPHGIVADEPRRYRLMLSPYLPALMNHAVRMAAAT